MVRNTSPLRWQANKIVLFHSINYPINPVFMMRQKPPPTVPPLEAASGGGLKVISYNEWPVDEKDRLHEFLVSNDI